MPEDQPSTPPPPGGQSSVLFYRRAVPVARLSWRSRVDVKMLFLPWVDKPGSGQCLGYVWSNRRLGRASMSRQSHIILLLRTCLRNTNSLPEPSSRPFNNITVIVCVEKRKPVNPPYTRALELGLAQRLGLSKTWRYPRRAIT